MNAWDWSWIMALAVKATLLIALVALLCHRDSSAPVRSGLWRSLFAALIALPLIALVLPPLELAWLPAAETPPPVLAHGATSTAIEIDPSPGIGTWLGWLAGVVSIVLLVGHLVSLHALTRLRRQAQHMGAQRYRSLVSPIATALGIEKRVGVYWSTQTETPISWGVGRITILLPADWLDREQAAIHALWHELAHARRGDWIWLLLQGICCRMLWWHPLVHWAGRKLSEETEIACDALALQHLDSATAYARTLVGTLRVRHSPALPMAAVERTLRRRLKHILNPSERIKVMHPITKVLTLAGLAVITFIIGSGRIVAHDTPVPLPELHEPVVAPAPPAPAHFDIAVPVVAPPPPAPAGAPSLPQFPVAVLVSTSASTAPTGPIVQQANSLQRLAALQQHEEEASLRQAEALLAAKQQELQRAQQELHRAMEARRQMDRDVSERGRRGERETRQMAEEQRRQADRMRAEAQQMRRQTEQQMQAQAHEMALAREQMHQAQQQMAQHRAEEMARVQEQVREAQHMAQRQSHEAVARLAERERAQASALAAERSALAEERRALELQRADMAREREAIERMRAEIEEQEQNDHQP